MLTGLHISWTTYLLYSTTSHDPKNLTKKNHIHIILYYDLVNSHEHAAYDQYIPQGNEDAEIPQVLEEFPYLVPQGHLLSSILKTFSLTLLSERITCQEHNGYSEPV